MSSSLIVIFVLLVGTSFSWDERSDAVAQGRKILSTVEECGVNRFNDPKSKKYKYTSGSRIVGGRESQEGKFPWLVRLQINRYMCGGSLITLKHILTAAHCLMKENKPDELVDIRKIQVIFGEHDRTFFSKKNFRVSVSKAKIHESYKPDPYYLNDIAIIELAREVNTTEFVRLICLPFGKTDEETSRRVIVAGWGYTIPGIKDQSQNVMARKLRMVELPLVSGTKCEAIYQKRLFNSKYQICAGGEKNKDSCGGDSGSPLMKMVQKISAQMNLSLVIF